MEQEQLERRWQLEPRRIGWQECACVVLPPWRTTLGNAYDIVGDSHRPVVMDTRPSERACCADACVGLKLDANIT